MGRLCYGPSLQWAEFAMGRDVQLPNGPFCPWSVLSMDRYVHTSAKICDKNMTSEFVFIFCCALICFCFWHCFQFHKTDVLNDLRGLAVCQNTFRV